MAMMIFVMTGCGDNNKQQPEIVVENEAALTQTIYADETSESISFVTTSAWTSSISKTGEWISIEPEYGDSAGTYTITIILKPNTTGGDRSASITFSCNKTDIFAHVTQKALYKDGTLAPQKGDVYVAGYDGHFAKLWKNGIAQNLNDGPFNAEAYSVYVSGSDVYVAGVENSIIGYVAKLWKNGVSQNLTDKPRTSANSVYVSGNDVYVAGYEYNADGFVFGVVWKNGIAQNLTAETQTAKTQNLATSIYVSGGDVYVAGSGLGGINGLSDVATVWKNGKAQKLTDGTWGATAHSVYVSGNNVYVAGNDRIDAIVWKDGVVQNLSDGTYEAMANSVYISDGVVYVAGYVRGGELGLTIATIWENNIAQKLTNGTGLAQAKSVFVSGSDVYVAGYDSRRETYTSIPFAVLWKNGITQSLTDGTHANSVFVVE